MLDDVLFVAFPYLSVVMAIVGGIYRYYGDRFSFSSFSSQFLENRALFWGTVPWHYGVLVILLAHLLALLFPAAWAELISDPNRLYALEVTGLALALMTTVALAWLIVRRLRNPRAFAVTTILDWLLLSALLAQVGLGFWVALFYRWGSDWYLYTAVPWLISLATFSPQAEFIAALPFVVKLHMLGGFVLVALFPFTRLVHVFTVPVTYLWRPYQVVVWNRRLRRAG
jgi:nitrate reductase gamma subunit